MCWCRLQEERLKTEEAILRYDLRECIYSFNTVLKVNKAFITKKLVFKKTYFM